MKTPKIFRYIENSLSSNEVLKYRFYLNNIVIFIPIFWVSLFFVSYYIFKMNIYVSSIFIVISIISFFELLSFEYGITNRRLIKKRGIFSRYTEELLINAIETIELQQSIIGRIFNYGNIIVTGRGQSEITFLFVNNPIEVKRHLEDILTEKK